MKANENVYLLPGEVLNVIIRNENLTYVSNKR